MSNADPNRRDLTPAEFAALQGEGADMAKAEKPKPEAATGPDGMTATEYALWQSSQGEGGEQVQTKEISKAPKVK